MQNSNVLPVASILCLHMAKKSPQVPPKTFEEAIREVEAILREIEGGQLGLEESLTKYERGNFLIRHCRDVLGSAEKQIELLSGSVAQGVVATPTALPTDLENE